MDAWIFSLLRSLDACCRGAALPAHLRTHLPLFSKRLCAERYQKHPKSVEEKCPALATVLNEISAGRFGDGGVYEPLLNTIRQGDYYLITEDFDSCASSPSLITMDINAD